MRFEAWFFPHKEEQSIIIKLQDFGQIHKILRGKKHETREGKDKPSEQEKISGMDYLAPFEMYIIEMCRGWRDQSCQNN
jgi:hypothetical protein